MSTNHILIIALSNHPVLGPLLIPYFAKAVSQDVISVEEIPSKADTKSCRVVVPDDQLSLAIGKEGQNARLAAKLTGYKIDIKPESAPLEPIEELIARAEAEAAEQALEDAMAEAEENGEIPKE